MTVMVTKAQKPTNTAPTSYTADVQASTCETCRNGCGCSGGPGWDGPTGCEHLGCWGPNATYDCPEATRLKAIREGV